MESFPKVELNEVVLLRADINTGNVLDEEFHICTNDKQKVFTVFKTLDDCLIFTREIFKERSEIEFIIYNSKHEFLKRITIASL